MKLFKLKWLAKLLVLVVGCMYCSSCATIYNLSLPGGNSQNITIRTSPSGADIYYKNKYIGKTPCTLYINMKDVNSTDFASISWNGKRLGELQLIEDHVSMANSTPAMLDLCTIVPFLIDIILLFPVKIIRSCAYDNSDCHIVYNERIIALDRLSNAPPTSGYIRLISPYSDLYADIKADSFFFGWDTKGFCHCNSKEQGRFKGISVVDVADTMNALANSIKQNATQCQTPPPAPSPTPAAPAQTVAPRPVTPVPKPNFKRWCPKHGEWDGRFSAGCPACRAPKFAP